MDQERADELGLILIKKEDKKIKRSKLSKISQTMRKLLDCCKE